MKKVASSVRGNPLPVGHTTMEKLSSMRVEAAAELLKSTTWREFFEKEKSRTAIVPTNDSKCVDGVDERGDFLPEVGGSVNPYSASIMSLQIRTREMSQNLEHVYNNLWYRIEDLWDTLKISQADRKFYRRSLLKDNAQSAKRCQELAGYIHLLQQYKASTLDVIQAIKCREDSVTRFYELFAGLQRKYSRLQVKDIAFKNSSNASVMSSDLNELGDVEAASGWKEDLLFILDDVRCNTLDVIKNIQLWRRNLWRPLPFIWRNMNYMQKLKNDINILESESSQRILSLLPLRYEDLLGVVFFDFRDERFKAENASPESLHNENISSVMSPLPIESSVGQSVSHVQNLIHDFLKNIPLSELQEATIVVLDDEMLQQAILAEKAALIQKGYFIPSLKMKADKRSKGKKQTKNFDADEKVDLANAVKSSHSIEQNVSREFKSIDNHLNNEISDAEMKSIISASFPPYKPYSQEQNLGAVADEIVVVGEEGLESPARVGGQYFDTEFPNIGHLRNQKKNSQGVGETLKNTLEENGLSHLLSEHKDLAAVSGGSNGDFDVDFDPLELENGNEGNGNEGTGNEGDLYEISSLEDDGVVRSDKKNKNCSEDDLNGSKITMDLDSFAEDLKGLLQGEDEIRFEDSKAEVGDGKLLQRVSAFLLKYPEIDLHIEGHTTCIGPTGSALCADDMNCTSLLLSEQRVMAIEQYLKDRGCINHFMSRGWGCKHPTVGSKNLIRMFP